MAKKNRKKAFADSLAQSAVSSTDQGITSFGEQEQDAIDKDKKKKGYKKNAPKFKLIVKNARPDTIEEAHIKQELYGIVRLNNRLSLSMKVVSIILTALFLFLVGSYLIYYYTNIADWNVTTNKHEHQFLDTPNFISGDCQNKNRYEWICTYPDCNELKVEYLTLGNHKFDMESRGELIEKDGKQYYRHTCTVCGEEHLDIEVTE